MIIQIIRLKSSLSGEELLQTARERAPRFEAIPGLLQKYYFRDQQKDQYGGIYIWDSVESLQAYKSSDLAASIPEAYEIIEPPAIELLDVLFQLRD